MTRYTGYEHASFREIENEALASDSRLAWELVDRVREAQDEQRKAEKHADEFEDTLEDEIEAAIKEEHNMLEAEIKKLNDQLGTLIAINEKIIAKLENPTPAPAPEKPQPQPEEPDTDQLPTLDDVRAAFLAAREAQGADAAKAVVTEVAGDVANITHVPEDKYRQIIGRLEQLLASEAA